MSSFDWWKNTEDSIKDGLIITVGASGIFFEGGKRKTTKGISRYYGYPKTCRWNLRKSAGERICSLQKMDQ